MAKGVKRKQHSLNADMRDDKAAREAFEVNRQQPVLVRKPDGYYATQQPCRNLTYCNDRRGGSSPLKADTARTAPKGSS